MKTDTGVPPKKIFSGDASSDMWAEIRRAKSKSTLRMALYTVCCRIQELEGKIDDIAEKQEENDAS